MEHRLPTLAELHFSPAEAFKNDAFKLLLNQDPHSTWVKDHPMAKKKNEYGQSVQSQYLPIDKVEALLDYIFQNWYPEVINVQALFNAISVTVRVHLKNPTTGEWYFLDGVGAAQIQTNAGASAADLSAIKASAVQMALPSAKSYAIKDACQHLGKLFGRDLNRRDVVNLGSAYAKEQEEQLTSQVPQTAPAPQPAVQVQYVTPPVQPDYNRPQYGAQPQAPVYNPNPPQYQPVQPATAQPYQQPQPPQYQTATPVNPFLNPNDL